MKHTLIYAGVAAALTLSQVHANDPMATGANGYTVPTPLFTVGENINGYFPPGILDGLGAYKLNKNTVRVLANHELLNNRGYPYEVEDGAGGTFTMLGARVSYFDIDKTTRQVVDSGLAYKRIYDANGNIATDISFLAEPFATNFGGAPGSGSQSQGFSRFCSSVVVEAGTFNFRPGVRKKILDRGLEDTIYFTGEEDGAGFNSVGGAEWALDVKTGDLWQVPMMGRGAWENISIVNTNDRRHVAFILMDDTSPFDVDDYAAEKFNDGDVEAAPIYLYIGEKKRKGNFLERNGLAEGQLYVWVSDTGEMRPSQFNTAGTLQGRWVAIDNSQNLAEASEDGSTGYDEYGYPTQRTLWRRAENLGAFGLSRPEDVAYNPDNTSEVVIASTGVDTYDIDPVSGNGSDTFGTMYTLDTNFHDLTASLKIIYDGDADTQRSLRSPDNLDWADDGAIYVQEDEAEEDTASGDEVLFGENAVNSLEASIVKLDAETGTTLTVATIDRSVVLDPSTTGTPFDLDRDANGFPNGEWESSGILDVSTLFDEEPGTLFIFDVQAHGIEDQSTKSIDGIGPNPDSKINDNDLVEGGQLLFLQSPEK